jgi:hypothetical protein
MTSQVYTTQLTAHRRRVVPTLTEPATRRNP